MVGLLPDTYVQEVLSIYKESPNFMVLAPSMTFKHSSSDSGHPKFQLECTAWL